MKRKVKNINTIINIRVLLLTGAGLVSSLFARLLGGFDALLQALIVFMVVDFILGWLQAAVFCTSYKSASGRLSSRAGFRGIVKKSCYFLAVIVAVYLDHLMGTTGIARDASIVAFSLNELLSIVENMGAIGIKIPAPIASAIDGLSKERPYTKNKK